VPFSIYIDESGEPGISKIRNENEGGASPYFVVGAAVFQPATAINAKAKLASFREKISKKRWKHATDLDHAEKVYFGRICSSINARYFAVISNKSTLAGYKDFIEDDAQKFYNKCVKYLLELICSYLLKAGAREEEISVMLEERNHNYSAMLSYLHSVQQNPMYEQSKSLRILNVFSISKAKKGTEDLLEYADFVSHAVYQLTNKTPKNFFIPEPRYYDEIKKRFAADSSGRILGTGIKCIHSLEDLDLDFDIKSLLENSRADPSPFKM